MISLFAKGLAYLLFATGASLGGVSDANVITETAPKYDLIPLFSIAGAESEEDDFAGYQTLKRICECESNLNHYNESGGVLRGRENRDDVGICQINRHYHGEDAEALNMNIYTKEGNIAFAKYLYDKYGTDPWIWSKPCWANK
jgi:hypothetical protein